MKVITVSDEYLPGYVAVMITVLSFCRLVAVTEASDICDYCRCERHSLTVTCTGYSILIRSVALPLWADTLYLHHMSLRHLPHFAYNQNLKVLRINHCGLTHIHQLSLSSLPNLETMHLADNLLADLPAECFFELPKLRILNLARNLIRDLHLITNILPPKHILEQLILDGNPIELSSKEVRLPVARQLHLSDSNMQLITDTEIVFLKSARCFSNSRCRTLQMPQQQWSILRTLDVSWHEELTIEASLLRMISNVSNLNFASSTLPPSFPDWLRLSSHVRHLNIASATITANRNSTWRWCGEFLERLDISRMGLRSILLEQDCTVRFLKASHNQLSEVTLASSTLEAVFLDNNQIGSWIIPPPGIAFTQLHTICLSSNAISHLPDNALAHYPQLQHLDISLNQLQDLSPTSFPSIGMPIRSINISHNKLSSFVHPVLPSLLLLDLSHNTLQSLHPNLFDGLPLLQNLFLNSNAEIFSNCSDYNNCWLHSLSQLVNLIELDLSECNLDTQPDFSSFQSMRKLDLSKNQIRLLDAALLPVSLTYLDVSQNQIHYVLNISTLERSQLHELDLSQNPLICECSLAEITPLLSNRTSSYGTDAYYCFAGQWQYPLRNYIENVKSCLYRRSDWLSTLWRLVALLATAGLLASIAVLLAVKANRLRCSPVLFAYRPLTSNEFTVVSV